MTTKTSDQDRTDTKISIRRIRYNGEVYLRAGDVLRALNKTDDRYDDRTSKPALMKELKRFFSEFI